MCVSTVYQLLPFSQDSHFTSVIYDVCVCACVCVCVSLQYVCTFVYVCVYCTCECVSIGVCVCVGLCVKEVEMYFFTVYTFSCE